MFVECGAAVVQLVRTPACHAGGRRFESRRSANFPQSGVCITNCRGRRLECRSNYLLLEPTGRLG